MRLKEYTQSESYFKVYMKAVIYALAFHEVYDVLKKGINSVNFGDWKRDKGQFPGATDAVS